MNEHEQRKQALYRAIRARGLSHAHAMGMLANAMGESNFRPDALNGPEGAYGLFQWRGDRLEALRNKYGQNPNIEAQVEFALSEPEGRAYAETHFNDPVAATDYFIRKFERPADPDAALRKRGSWAQSNAANFGQPQSGMRAPMTPPPLANLDPVWQGVDPRLAMVFEEVKRRHPELAFKVTEGMRDRARQEQLVAAGKSQTMNSRHLHGHAVDVAPMVDGQPTYDWKYYHPFAEAVKATAADMGIPLEWGGDWKSFKDGPHWQLAKNAPTFDPRMASLNGGGYAVGTEGLADRWSQLPQIPQLPEEQAMQDPTVLHPQLQAILEQQRRGPDPWAMLGAMGAGILNAGGGPGAGNWFGKGVAAAMNTMQQNSPEQLTMLQMLQANNELYELDARRAEAQRAKQQQAMQRQYLQSIADNESLPMPTRFQAQNQLLGLKAGAIELPEAKTYGTPSTGIWREEPGGGMSQVLPPQGEEAVKTVGTPDKGVWERTPDGWEQVIAPQDEANSEYEIKEVPGGNGYIAINPRDPSDVQVIDMGVDIPEAALPPGVKHTDIASARTQYNTLPEVKAYNAGLVQYENLRNVLADVDNPAANVAAIFSFMKALDPTSVVRESEQGMVFQASGPAEQFASYMNQLFGRGRITEESAKNIREAAYAALMGSKVAARQQYDRYRELAVNQYGLKDPSWIVGGEFVSPTDPKIEMGEKKNDNEDPYGGKDPGELEIEYVR